MRPNLQSILTYEPFRRAAALVVAGENDLERPVRWVHISEMPDPARLFQGSELLLTQGRGISSEEAEQRRWIRSLVEAGIAGVAVEVGVAFPSLPRALVHQARQDGLPLIRLTHPAYFMDMTEAVHSAIVNAHYGTLQRAESINRRFSRLALEGAGLSSMIAELARAVDHPVVLSDESHEIVAFAPQDAGFTALLRGWSAHARVGHSEALDGAPTSASAAGIDCVWVPIVVRGELSGTLHMLELDGEVEEVDRLALDRAAAAIGLAFAYASASHLEYQRDDARSVFVRDLLGGHYADIREMRLKAAGFGLQLTGEFRVLILRPLDSPAYRSNERAERVVHPFRTISNAVSRAFGLDTQPLVASDSGQLVVLLPTPHRTGNDDDVRRRTVDMVEDCAKRHGIQLLVGLGDSSSVVGLPQAFADASATIRYAVRTRRRRCVLSPDELGIDRLLLELDQGPALCRHIERELGAILDHDATSRSPLLPTLIAFLNHDGRKADAARALNIERRTLYYRLDRIEELIKGSLHDIDTRLRLLIAVRGRDFRRDQRTSDQTG